MTNLLDDNNNQTNDVRIDEQKDYLAELTGPGGKFDRTKYQSEDDMWKAIARSKVEADLTIQNRNARLDELRNDYLKLREDYNAGPKLQELVDRLTQSQQNLQGSDDTLNADGDNGNAFDLTEIEKLVANKIQETERSKREDENLRLVKSKLKERYGDNHNSALIEQVERLGLTMEDAEALAKKSPNAFFKTLGLDQQPQGENFQTPPPNNQRTDNFSPSTQKRTWSYYQDMKRKDPKLYYSPKTADQMFKDAMTLGEAFKDGDWKLWN